MWRHQQFPPSLPPGNGDSINSALKARFNLPHRLQQPRTPLPVPIFPFSKKILSQWPTSCVAATAAKARSSARYIVLEKIHSVRILTLNTAAARLLDLLELPRRNLRHQGQEAQARGAPDLRPQPGVHPRHRLLQEAQDQGQEKGHPHGEGMYSNSHGRLQ